MIALPKHGRRLALCGVALTKARNNRHGIQALGEVRDEIEQMMIDSRYLDHAPFSWVTISIRYGLKTDATPEYQAVNSKHGDLPLAIEIDTHQLIAASFSQVRTVLKHAVLRSLIDAGKRYACPTERLEAELSSTKTVSAEP